MASSQNNDALIPSQELGAVIADVLENQMLDETDQTPEDAVSNAQGVNSKFESLLDSSDDNTNHPGVTTFDSTVLQPSDPNVASAATYIVESISTFRNDLSSIINPKNSVVRPNISEIAPDDQPTTASIPSTPIGQPQAQTPTTADDNKQSQSLPRRHIMISYHHRSSYEICQRICKELKKGGYRVWMDTSDLHGSIHQGMADAVENAHIVLFCINDDYCQSTYCWKEAVYTDIQRISFIPVRLQHKYKPQGRLGILIGDQLYIDFSPPNNFDTAFEQLITEIQIIEARLSISTIPTENPLLRDNTQRTEMMSNLQMNASANNQTQSEALEVIIRDFRESINQRSRDAQSMTEEEFSQFIGYIRRRVFAQNSPSLPADNDDSREILKKILRQSQNQTESLKRITEILSNTAEIGLIIKLCLIFAFVWAINKFSQT